MRGVSPGAPAGGWRILVVDDNVDAAELLGEALSMLGHEVAVVFDGHQVEPAALRLRPHVVLLDLGLPELDGYAVAARLRARPELDAVALVALTGYDEREHRERSLQAGFARHLTKPIDLKQLKQCLAELAD